MKQWWKRAGAITLAAVLLLTAGPLELLRDGLTLIVAAADVPQLGEQTTLRFGMTWLYNNGSARETTGNGYLRNKARKEYLVGDPSDSKWGKYANSYVFCVANHELWPNPGSIAYVEAINTFDDLPWSQVIQAQIDKYNFTFAMLTMYYLSRPESTAAMQDPYQETARYLIAKPMVSLAYEGGYLLPHEYGYNWSTINWNIETLYEGDFHPDTQGSSRVYEEIVQEGFEINGRPCTYKEYVFNKIYEATEYLSSLNYQEGMGFTYAPQIAQGEDGKYHAKLVFEDTAINRKYWSNIQAGAVYGDWTFAGYQDGAGGAPYLDFVSPTGQMPAEGKIADMSFAKDSEFDQCLTDFHKGSIIKFDFRDGSGRVGQSMLAASLEGNFSVAVAFGGESGGGEGGGETGQEGSFEVKVDRYRHEESWEANYNVDLIKYDSETGKPLEGAGFDILEAFDDSQLDGTALDILDAKELGYQNQAGGLNPTEWGDDAVSSNYNGELGLNPSERNRYNWKNEEGTQFEHWEGWDPGEGEAPCPRDNDITGPDGHLHPNTSNGLPDLSKTGHTDTRSYTYEKGYCGGHPAPVIHYVPVPEPEYDEEGDISNQGEIDAANAANQSLHDQAWAKWLEEVQRCEALVEQGGFFHSVGEGAGKPALEADRDGFYRDFVSLDYEYSARETNARGGYILHGIHKDDIVIETRTVSSSEGKDLNENGLNHEGGSEESGSQEEQAEEAVEILEETAAEAAAATPAAAHMKTASPSEAVGEESLDRATRSNADNAASSSDATPSVTKTRQGNVLLTGLVHGVKEAVRGIWVFFEGLFSGEEDGSGREGVTFLPSQANTVQPGASDIVDWTFIVYDHRQEGEIHFNKRDLDLSQGEYDSYGQSNGDGTLEGAVYGLFAKSDIVHPDGNTGTVYKQNDLVAVASTDRDGNGSFMAYTEAPGSTYNDETGAVEKRTDVSFDGSGNLYTDEAASVALNQDNEQFVGHDKDNRVLTIKESVGETNSGYRRVSSNQDVSYEVQNNQANNGNCWIGRPLIAGDYYIKELSRSEGYELSVYGKNAAVTNREAMEHGGEAVSGSVKVSGWTENDTYRGNLLTAQSQEIGEQGYDIFLNHMPEEALPQISTYEIVTKEETMTYEKPIWAWRNQKAAAGNRVIIDGKPVAAEAGDTVTLPNGERREVGAVTEAEPKYQTVYPRNYFAAEPPVLGADEEASDMKFIQQVNMDLGKVYQEPSAGAPWKLVRLEGESKTRWAKDLTDALKDLTAFNAMYLEDILDGDDGRYAVLRYSYVQGGEELDSLYDEQHDRILVKQPLDMDGTPGFVYVPYARKDLTGYKENESGFITQASAKVLVPAADSVSRYEDLERLEYREEMGETYWIYQEGDDLLNEDGSVAREQYISGYETVTETVTVEEKQETRFPADQVFYDRDNDRYVIHVKKEQIPEDGTLEFEIDYGVEMVEGQLPGQFMAEHVTVSAAPSMATEDNYLANVSLSGQGDETVILDGNTGTAPAQVYERPIRQKIKVVKDIQTNPDGGYLDNTYDVEAVKKAANFRFKAYLKSNLERLYRDEEGNITWLDRNGNVISYEDMLSPDFPEEADNGNVQKTNVRKIFTKVLHDTGSNLTSINGNNVLSSYQDPETADTNAAWKTPFDTFIADKGIGVIVNAALYSFRGRNQDAAESDAIRAEQNLGYTRLLETVERQAESGGELVTVQEYNYAKFFDAMETANVDKWDDKNQTYTSWKPLGNQANRSEYAENNAKASDQVRQFAITWYLEDEAAKLAAENGQGENEGKEGSDYTEQVYDQALNAALEKAYNYLKPFFAYDLDEIYAVSWDSEAGGGKDQDKDTLSADQDGESYTYGLSCYLPYGTYVIVEQQPKYVGEDEAAFNDFLNKHYQIDQPKEVMVPAVYEEGTETGGSRKLNQAYQYDAHMPLVNQAGRYQIRFGEEWDGNGGDQRQYVIRAHNNDGDFEVYKYGLEPDKLSGTISYEGESYGYRGYGITQEEFDPLKDYYNPIHQANGKPLTREQGANENSHYYGDDGNKGVTTANGETYEADAVEKRYHYGSVSEQAGRANNVRFEHEMDGSGDNGAGAVYRDAAAMQGVQTAYDGLYAPMLVPYSVVEPEDETQYAPSEMEGYADGTYRNTLYTAKLRIEKLDSETHENLLHDGALFLIYKAQRDETTGQAMFYEEDTTIQGSEEFLKAMGAEHIQTLRRDNQGTGTLYSGIVKAGTPICSEEDKIVMPDAKGNRVGQFEAFSTINDISMKNEDTNAAPNEYRDQTTGYLETPQPLGAGVYVLCEVPPRGYVRTAPIAVEIYSDKVTYYKEGHKDQRVHAAIYEKEADGIRGNGNKLQDKGDVAQIYVENIPIKLQVEKLKETGEVTFRVGERVEGSLTEIGGDPQLEYAYSNGVYLGYAYPKGTLERLAALKEAGEQVELVYEGGHFAGYGYVTRTRETDDDANPYVAGAVMTLFDAIELKPSGDTEDLAYEGLRIERNDNGSIRRMYVQKGFAGEKTELVKELDENGEPVLEDYVVEIGEDGTPVTKKGYVWKEGTVERPDTDLLYYDLDSLSVTWTERMDGRDILYGWDKDHQKTAVEQIQSDMQNHHKNDREPSIYAFKGGQPYLEFVGGDLTKVSYNPTSKILEGDFAKPQWSHSRQSWKMGDGTFVYHLDSEGRRDAMVDPYTGMAYVLEPVTDEAGEHRADRVLVWPVEVKRDSYGNVIARDKISTSRIGTIGENQEGYQEDVTLEPMDQSGQEIADSEKPGYSHRESGYINGSWESEKGEESHQEQTIKTNGQGQNMNGEILTDIQNGDFLKYMNPVYDEKGLVLYYQRSDETYDKGTELYDRNGDFVRYKDSDNLEEYNRAAYALDSHENLYDGDSGLEHQEQDRLYHRQGESYILENTWTTSDRTPNDPFETEETAGQADLIKRLPAGTYILEELSAPEGFVKAEPVGITVTEDSKVQNVAVKDDTTKGYIEKIDGPVSGKVKILDMDQRGADGRYADVGENELSPAEYTNSQLPGAQIALYPARFVTDLSRPEGYRLEKTSEAPLTFETTDSTVEEVRHLTASWTTGPLPVYVEGIPAGWYILEELSAPEGFVKAEPVNVRVDSQEEIVSVQMKDEHTKLMFEKYTLEGGERKKLNGAEFTLYQAVTDEKGEIVYEDGIPQYQEDAVIDQWVADDATDYTETINLKDYPNTSGKNQMTGFTLDFERMFEGYGINGTGFSWSVERTAKRDSAASQAWVLEDGSRVITGEDTVTFPESMSKEDREGFKAAYQEMAGEKTELKWAVTRTAQVTQVESFDIEATGGMAEKYPDAAKVYLHIKETGKDVRADVRYNGKDFAYAYKFDYHSLPRINRYANAWLQADGRYRMDYLPVGGKYVLVETKAPAGYAKAEPVAVTVEELVEIQLHDVLNERSAVLLSKTSSETGKELPGAKLALYRADETGGLTKENQYLIEQWISGNDGTYTETDLINGRIPEGYQVGDLRPHSIYGLPDGIYYLTETEAPAYYQAIQPVRFQYTAGEAIRLVRAADEPVTGKLLVHKTDEEGGSLTGVVFELYAYDEAGKRVSGFPKKLSDTNGTVTAEGLPVGEVDADGTIHPYTYKLKEITPPDGFAANPQVLTFTFPADGDYREEPEVRFSLYETEAENGPTRLWIEKKDFEHLNDQGTDGAFVDGAVLAVYEAKRNEEGEYTYEEEDLFEEWTTDREEGRHLLTGLSAGRSYILVEKQAPEGYTLMKPVVFTVSESGRAIEAVSNRMTMVKVDYIKDSDLDNPDKDSIAAVAIRGRKALKTEVAMLNEDGREILRFLATGREQVIPKTEGMEENGLYTFVEHTIYSDGSDVITKKLTRRVRFGEQGFVYQSRAAQQTALALTDSQGALITTLIPTQAAQEQTVVNPVRPENPQIVVKNRNGQAGEPLVPGQAIVNTITYYNPSSKPQTVAVRAVMDENVELLDPYEGEADGNVVAWSIPDVPPFTQGTVSFAADLAEGHGNDTLLSVEVRAGKQTYTGEKRTPILRPNQLTLRNELTGSGQEPYAAQTSRFTIRLWDERGRELAGSYRYTGSRSGILRSGDSIELAGNEYITIDPDTYKNCAYEIVREEDGIEVKAFHTKGTIAPEGAGAWFTRHVSDTSQRQIFVKGETYFLTETTRYSNGDERISSRMSFTLDESAGITTVGGYDKETEVAVSKTDITTGEELPGSHLKVTDENGETVDQWVSGSEPHIIKGLEPGKRYTLTETRPADGYAYAKEIPFFVNGDGTVDEILMEDAPTQVAVSKKDMTNREELPGAHLQILDQAGNVIEEWVSTSEPHRVVGKLVAGQTYILRETIPADGFVKAEEIVFTVSLDGTVDLVEMKDDTTKVQIHKNEFVATPSTPSQAGGGKPLAGAVLQILNEDKTPALYQGKEMIFTTGERFAFFEKQLIAGNTYYLHEVKPAPGFAYAEDVKFTVSEDGSVDVVVMEDKPTAVSITKTDITGEQEVPGCRLRLVDETGQLIDQWVSVEQPHEIVGKLEAGKTYRLIEVSPAPGYAYSREVTFTVSLDGRIDRVQMKDDVTKVEILKISAETGEPLAGAEFEIRDRNGAVMERWVSAEKAHRIEGKLNAGETYILHEGSAPQGYEPMEDIEFTVNSYSDVLRITAENRKKGGGGGGSEYTVRLKKIDETGSPVIGAVFRVMDKAGKSLTLTEEEGGTVFKAVVSTPQTLTVTEITAPDGYEKLTKEYQIQIPKEGEAVLLNGDETFYQDKQDSFVFYAVNGKEEPLPEGPKGRKGRILARFDRSLLGKGTAQAAGRGGEFELAGTGDPFPMARILVLALLSGGGIVWLLRKGKKRGRGGKKGRRGPGMGVFLLALCLGTAGADSAQAQAYGQEQKEDRISREKTYLSSEDSHSQENPGFPETLSLEGKTYFLDHISYETVEKKRNPEPSQNLKVVVSEPFTGDAAAHMPKETLREGEQVWYLKSSQVVERTLDARTQPVQDEIVYTAVPLESEIPQAAQVEVRDQASGETLPVQVPLVSKEYGRARWAGGFELPIWVVDYEAEVFDLNGREVTLSPSEPLAGCEELLLSQAGLTPENYRIHGIRWDGEAFEREGIWYRKLLAEGEMRVADCRAVYSGVANLPEVKAKAVEAVYSSRPATASQAKAEGGYTYTIKAEAVYSADKDLPDLQDVWIKKVLRITFSLGCLVLLLLCLVFFIRTAGDGKGKKGGKKHGDR